MAYSNIRGSGGSGDGWDSNLGTDGGGNIDSDPMFVRNPSDGGDGLGDDPSTEEIDESANDDYGDLRLLASSPCIDAGDSTFCSDITKTLFDLGDNARAVDIPTVENTGNMLEFSLSGGEIIFAVDMGAYEYQGTSVSPVEGDLTGDGKVDMADMAVLAANWLVSN